MPIPATTISESLLAGVFLTLDYSKYTTANSSQTLTLQVPGRENKSKSAASKAPTTS